MRVSISSKTIGELLAWAAASDDEICGLLLGDAGTIFTARLCTNVADDPRARFEIDPAALIAAHRAARQGGPTIVGCFHSHPAGLAMPSPRDAADAAADGSLWLIVAGGRVTAWRAVAAGERHGRFESVALDVMAAPVAG